MDPNTEAVSQWSLTDWNRRLVAGILRRTGSGSFEPIRNLLVSREALARAVSVNAMPDLVVDAFTQSVRRHLSLTGWALDVDARKLAGQIGWTPSADADPPFWVHLIFTCFVASAPEVSGDHDFRRRLSALLGTATPQQLLKLPSLWEEVAEWTRLQQQKKKPCRELILPDPGWTNLIGYSLRLAFPVRKDTEALIRVLGEEDLLGVEPPVRPTMHAIESARPVFTEGFRMEYDEFRQSWHSDPTVIHHSRLWSAVRDAALYGRAVKTDSEPALGILLSQDTEGEFCCWITSDKTIERRGWFTLRDDSLAEQHLLCLDSRNFDGAQRAALSVLGRLRQLPGPMPGLARALTDGLLMFEKSAAGLFSWSPTFPNTEDVLLLVSKRLKDDVSRTLDRPSISTSYPDWFVTQGLTRSHLLEVAKSLPQSLTEIRALQPTAVPLKMWVADGFYADAGTSVYVGLPCLLPRVRVDGADSVIIEPQDKNKATFTLSPRCHGSDDWALPATRLNGDFTLVALRQRHRFATRAISFAEQYYGHQYKTESSSSTWLKESLAGPLEVIKVLAHVPNLVDEDLFNADFFSVDLKMVPPYIQTEEEEERINALGIALASMLSHQQRISEMELYDIFMRVLRVEAWRVPQISRAWVESGRLVRITSQRWRATAYLGIKPHLVAYRSSGQTHGTTVGLFYPELLRSIAQRARNKRATVERLHASSPWSPLSVRISASSIDTLHQISESAGLGPIQTVPMPSAILRSVTQLMMESTSPPTSRQPRQSCDFPQAAGVTSLQSPVAVDYYVRPEAPDEYCVRFDGAPKFCSQSRTSAWLVAGLLAGKPIFQFGGTNSLCMRTRQTFLPLAAGYMASLFNVASPAPEFSGNSAYTYWFPSSKLRFEVSKTLFPDTALDVPEYRHFAVWLAHCANSSGLSDRHIPITALGDSKVLHKLEALRPILLRGTIPIRLIPLWMELLRRANGLEQTTIRQ